MTERYSEIAKAELAVWGSLHWGRVDVSFEYAVEHIRWAARYGRTPHEVCAALGEPRPMASWGTALWLVAEYANAMRAAGGAVPETR